MYHFATVMTAVTTFYSLRSYNSHLFCQDWLARLQSSGGTATNAQVIMTLINWSISALKLKPKSPG
jgi:hypothetical protein